MCSKSNKPDLKVHTRVIWELLIYATSLINNPYNYQLFQNYFLDLFQKLNIYEAIST